VKDNRYVFREPTSIVHMKAESAVVFVYGDGDDITDEQFFEELKRASSEGMGADDAFKALDKDNMRIYFELSDAPPRTVRMSTRRRGRGKAKPKNKKAKGKKRSQKLSKRSKSKKAPSTKATKKKHSTGAKTAQKSKSKAVAKKKATKKRKSKARAKKSKK